MADDGRVVLQFNAAEVLHLREMLDYWDQAMEAAEEPEVSPAQVAVAHKVFGSDTRADADGAAAAPKPGVPGVARVYDDADVYDEAAVYGNAVVYASAHVFGAARVYGEALIHGNAAVSGGANVYGAADVYGDAEVYGDAHVHGNAGVYGGAHVHGHCHVGGFARVYGEARIVEGYIAGYADVSAPHHVQTWRDDTGVLWTVACSRVDEGYEVWQGDQPVTGALPAGLPQLVAKVSADA